MPDYKLSRLADRDLSEIARYTIKHWSEHQADDYFLGLHRLLSRLAQKPEIGIASDHISLGYLRYRFRSHMVFYKKTRQGIFIVRVLHGRMDFTRHL